MLHYFHSADRTSALAPAVAVLDDALTLLRHGVARPHRLEGVTLCAATQAVEALVEALYAAHIDPVDDPPGPPELQVLHQLRSRRSTRDRPPDGPSIRPPAASAVLG